MSYLLDERPATQSDIGEVRAEIKELRSEIREELRHMHDLMAAQTRTHVVASLGSAVTVAGLVFIAAQIV